MPPSVASYNKKRQISPRLPWFQKRYRLQPVGSSLSPLASSFKMDQRGVQHQWQWAWWRGFQVPAGLASPTPLARCGCWDEEFLGWLSVSKRVFEAETPCYLSMCAWQWFPGTPDAMGTEAEGQVQVQVTGCVSLSLQCRSSCNLGPMGPDLHLSIAGVWPRRPWVPWCMGLNPLSLPTWDKISHIARRTHIIWKLIINMLWSHCGYFEPFSHSLLVDNTFLPESTGSAISQGPEGGARGEEGWLVSAEGTAKACGREAALQCQGTATHLV